MIKTRTYHLQQIVEAWATDARTKVEAGTISGTDLDTLLAAVNECHCVGGRQRLLYLHASNPSIYSELIGGALHEPESGAITQIDPMAPELPYNSVHEAVTDGWRVIHFPQQLAPFEDREIDVMGYEFILEKMEGRHV